MHLPWIREPSRSTDIRHFPPSPDEPLQTTSKIFTRLKNSAEISETENQNKPVTRGQDLRYRGWRRGAFYWACAAIAVFCINFAFTLWATIYSKGREEMTIYEDCSRASKWNSGIHLVINLLSTVLLSASNYCMQCLSAPTRKEVDGAHAKGVWLDIGISSIRNLLCRVMVWIMLGLTSVPLHLFYNSMVYSSIATNDYIGFKFKVVGDLELLENSECINRYFTSIQTSRRNLLLVTSESRRDTGRNSLYEVYNATDIITSIYFLASDIKISDAATSAFDWVCDPIKGVRIPDGTICIESKSQILDNAEIWTVNGYKVQYCLSERAPFKCKLHILLPIGWLVAALNFAKVLLILYTIFTIEQDPLMTMGDAVASFINIKDPTTTTTSIMTVWGIKKNRGFSSTGPIFWKGKEDLWMASARRARPISTFVMLSGALLVMLFLLDWGITAIEYNGANASFHDLVDMGFGRTDPRTIINGMFVNKTMINIILANLPQVVLSLIYLCYNGLFTCMLLGHEWSRFPYQRKGLRVSHARSGAQRSTYFLQLPYRFSLPLMCLSAFLHWAVSQAIFLVAIDIYGDMANGADTEPDQSRYSWTSCGYSPMAIICCMIVVGLMLISVFIFGSLKYKRGMPLVGSCSAAMSGACHAEEFDGVDGNHSAKSKLQWGVVGVNAQGVGRCAFSSKEVTFPEEGKLYA
ncbi:hypothetical protein B0J11DRAFT_496386 [Dendryphion nanum]|uniref:DUF6536 domain-containing protein n=1 Tax=Dendryphion nanum TaxID=256645 RepID=A0A9P9ID24_9PLEO|nr:hypothetical protein B0J11DRAFT_496386 [Dendryphion nanum]